MRKSVTSLLGIAAIACTLGLAGCTTTSPQGSDYGGSVGASTSTTSSPDTEADRQQAIVKTDLTNAKTAITAYQTAKGSLPTEVNTKLLGAYGYTSDNITQIISYSTDTNVTPNVFCLVAGNAKGARYYIGSTSSVTIGKQCPYNSTDW
jgi:hypothetical protein